jgi:Ca2+-binding RTX toxin-like protein
MSEKIKPVPSPLIFGDIGSTVSKSDVEIDGTKGDDLFIYTMGAHGKHEAEYDAGAGTDTLQLNFTAAQWASSAVQADITHFKAFLAAPAPAHGEKEFEFTAFKLEAEGFEKLKVMVDGVQVYPASGIVIVGADGVGGDFVGTDGNDTITASNGGFVFNNIIGGAGNDVLTGGSTSAFMAIANNNFWGGDGNDYMIGGNSTGYFSTTQNNFHYGSGADTMVGGDVSNNGSVQNTFFLENWSANASIVGGTNGGGYITNSIEASGTAGNDHLVISGATWSLNGVAISVSGPITAIRFDGGAGNNLLDVHGYSGGTAQLTGGAGNDTFIGAFNADPTIVVNNEMTGGAGADLFEFLASPSSNGNVNIIHDFTAGVDKIAISAAGYGTNLSPGTVVNVLSREQYEAVAAASPSGVAVGTNFMYNNFWSGGTATLFTVTNGEAHLVAVLEGMTSVTGSDIVLI